MQQQIKHRWMHIVGLELDYLFILELLAVLHIKVFFHVLTVQPLPVIYCTSIRIIRCEIRIVFIEMHTLFLASEI